MMRSPSNRPSGDLGRLTHHLGDWNWNVRPVLSSTPAA